MEQGWYWDYENPTSSRLASSSPCCLLCTREFAFCISNGTVACMAINTHCWLFLRSNQSGQPLIERAYRKTDCKCSFVCRDVVGNKSTKHHRGDVRVMVQEGAFGPKHSHKIIISNSCRSTSPPLACKLPFWSNFFARILTLAVDICKTCELRWGAISVREISSWVGHSKANVQVFDLLFQFCVHLSVNLF